MDPSSRGWQQNLAIRRDLDAAPNKTISYHFASESFSIVFLKVLEYLEIGMLDIHLTV